MNALEKLKKLYSENIMNLPDSYNWEDEDDRIVELYYCLLQRMTRRNEVDVRNIVTSLKILGLLNIESLAEAKLINGKGGKGDELISLITGILIQNGFEDRIAKNCTLVICRVARGIQENYHGTLQLFLRKYANQMIEELENNIPLPELTQEDLKYAITLWLQNTLELPIHLDDEYVQTFCRENGFEIRDLIAAADKLGINASVIDDLVKLHILNKSK